MNVWTAPKNPHQNDPHFPFDPDRNNPVKRGKSHLGKKRPPLRTAKPRTAKEQFEAMCATLLALIDRFNDATMKCKVAAAGNDQKKKSAAKKPYELAVAALNRFIGKTPGVLNPGYEQFVHSDSLKLEVVLSSGFVLAARVIAAPIIMSNSGPIKPYGSLVCSSSYYSL